MDDIESQDLKSPDVEYLPRKPAATFIKKRIGYGSPLTLARYAVEGSGPAFHKVGSRVLYAVPDLIEWCDAKIGPKQTSTSDAPDESYKKHKFGRPRKVAPDATSDTAPSA